MLKQMWSYLMVAECSVSSVTVAFKYLILHETYSSSVALLLRIMLCFIIPLFLSHFKDSQTESKATCLRLCTQI